MAESPAHRLGQILGEILELGVEDLLTGFAERHGLYLDKKGSRPARGGSKVRWIDVYGNYHDLDYVLEKGGDHLRIGTPVAFIESAWRSYTKHSRAKAQEIQGAVLPVVDHHRMVSPFTGVVLGGVFTTGALKQLESLGFTILYFPQAIVTRVFAQQGLDISFREDTPLVDLASKVAALEKLDAAERRRIVGLLFAHEAVSVAAFLSALEGTVLRQVDSVTILPLHGSTAERFSIAEAVGFVNGYQVTEQPHPFRRMEVIVKFSNGNRVEGTFADRESAVRFLRGFEIPPLVPPPDR